MIDLSQWRASIGLWNHCQAASSGSRIYHSQSFKDVDKSASASSVHDLSAILFFTAFVFSLYFTSLATSINCYWPQCAIGNPTADIQLTVLIRATGDVELNPGPRIDEQPSCFFFTKYLQPLVDVKTFSLCLPGMLSPDVNRICNTQQSIQHKKVAMHEKWLEVNPAATWRDVIVALEQCQENELARVIQKKLNGTNGETDDSMEYTTSDAAPASSSHTMKLQIFQAQSDKLTRAIATRLFETTNSLYAKNLISPETKSYIETTIGVSDYVKASRLVFVLEQQLDSSLTAVQYLKDVCLVLVNQKHPTMTDIATSILQEIGLSVPDIDTIVGKPIPDDVQQYAQNSRQLYKHQPDIAQDWPPKVGKDVYGRLVLIEKDEDAMITDEAENKNSAWYLLRGKVDKIIEMSENREIDVKDILQPIDSSVSLRVIIDGPPGIGKTTLCYKLLKMWSEGTLLHNHYDLVLYCPLRNSKIAAATTLANLFMTKSSKVSSIVEWILDRDGDGLLIIFDGWDELSSQLRESSLVASIISREKLDQCSVIVTSRTYASSSLLDVTPLNRHIQVIGFAEDELSTVIIRTLQKDEKMAQELIDKKKEDDRNGQPFTTTHSSKGSQLAANLINDLKVRGDVQSLCYVPLVCSMVILVYRKKQGHLPTTLSELYENFILQTIRRHAKLRNVDPYILGNLSSLPSQFATAFKEMCRIAYANLANTKVAFSTYELQEQLLSETVIGENYLGLITTFMEYDEKKHQFIHLSIQEFLAAWWIAKHEEKTEDVFKKHFDNEHFRMCLRFVAGLTHLEHESYQQYFKREQLKLLAQCKRDRMNGFQMSCFSPFNQNYQIRARHVRYDNYDNFPILLLQLLYESQNTTLCQVLAQSINNSSICLEEIPLSFFDWLCLSYFINNSRMTWNHLHLGLIHAQSLSILTKGLTNMSNDAKCKRLEVHLRNGELLQKLLQQSFLRIIQECYCSLEGDLCTALLLLLNLPQLKVLHLVIEFSFTAAAESAYPEKCSKLEKCIEMNSTIQEMNIEYEECSDSQLSNTIAVVIRGLTQNRSITSLTMNIALADDCPSSPLPDGVIEHLLKNNNTLKALSLNIPNKLLPSSLSVVEVNTPLTALNIGKLSSSLMTSLLPHIKELHCLILPRPYPPHLLFHSHPNLQTLYLPLDTTDGAIELFTALQKNNTLKALRTWMERNGGNTEEMYTSSMGASLEDMLTQNKTLKYLEINRHNIPLPSSFLPFLTAGMRRNISLQQISIPLIINENEDVRAVFDVISQKSILTELDVSFSDSFHSNNTDQEDRKIVTPLFFKQALPAVTEMLHSHKTIKLLRIWCPLSNDSPQPEWKQLAQHFYEAVYTHPSLEFFSIMIGSQDSAHLMEDVHKNQEKAWIERHKQEQPNKPVPIVKLVKYR